MQMKGFSNNTLMLDIFSDLAAILNLEPFVRMDYGRGADCNLEVIQHIGYPPQVNLIWRGRQRQRQRHFDEIIDTYKFKKNE